MSPKNKGITVIGSSTVDLPVPTQTGDGVDADGRGGGDHEHPRRSGDRSQASGIVRGRYDDPRAAGSKDGVVLPTGGTTTSKTPQPAPASRYSQAVHDERRHDVGDNERPHGKSPEHHS